MKKLISGFLAAILIMCSVSAVSAHTKTVCLDFRQPVNTLRISGTADSLQYSNTGCVWQDISFVQIDDICYFNTVDARLLSINGGEIHQPMYVTESINPYADGFDNDIAECKTRLSAANETESLIKLEKMQIQLEKMSKDNHYSRYDVMNCRRQIEVFMEGNMVNQFYAARQAIQNCIANAFVYAKSIDTNVLNYCNTISVPDSEEGTLWSDINGINQKSSALTSLYKRIFLIAQTYQCADSSYYHDAKLLTAIKTALNTADKYWYNTETQMYGNWWDFLIGVPENYSKTLSIIWDELSEEEQERYAAALEYFCRYESYSYVTENANERQAGANLVNISNYDYIMGVLTRNEEKIDRATENFYSVFKYCDYGSGSDGFYQDGSFLQHGVPYNGSYGREFLQGVVDMAESLDGTKWGFSDEHYVLINEWIDNGYLPFVFRSCMMDMVNGRAIARNKIDKQYGYQIGRVILHYANMLEDIQKKKEYCETVKYWFTKSSECGNISWRTNCDKLSEKLIESDKYNAVDHTAKGIYVYPNMDRVVYRPSDEWAIGLGFYSERIPSYELTNGENLKGWYTGAGAVYLYNEDDTQYTDNYWITADMYAIAGTTADSTQRYSDGEGSHYQTGDAEGVSGCDFVGGLSMGNVGAAAMDFAQVDTSVSNLTAKKSYFLLPEGIMCIGSGINGGNGDVYTTIENRAVNENRCTLRVNNAEEKLQSNQSRFAQTIHLSGECGNIGYYFPYQQQIEISYDTHTGAQADVKYDGSKDIVTKSFVTVKKHHGLSPSNASYSYMLLPDMTFEQTEEYSINPAVNIVCDENDIHAIYHKNTHKTAAVFYQAGTFETADGTSIHTNVPLMLIMDDDGDLAVCDPTGKLTEAEVTIGKNIKYSGSEKTTVTYSGDSTAVSFNLTNQGGQSVCLNSIK